MSKPSYRRSATIALIAAFAVACGGGDGATGNRDLAGTYKLSSIDGQPLPLTRTEVTSLGTVSAALGKDCCTVTLDAGGTFTRSLAAVASQGFLSSPVTAEDRGTYSLDGSALRFISTSQRVSYIAGVTETTKVDTTTATYASGRITFAGDATTFVTGALLFVK